MSIEALIADPGIFQPLDEPFLNYGYILGQSVWVKFTLTNHSDSTLHRNITIDNFMIDTLELFTLKEGEAKLLATKGLMHRERFDGIIMFSFPVTLAPKSETTYYFRAYTESCATWFKLELLTADGVIKKDITRQVILSLFFGGMLTLIVYNFFLLFFTKDSIYFFYVLYLFSLIAHHQALTSMGLYWIPLDNRAFVEIEAFFGIHYLNFISFSMALFVRQFLQTRQYPRLDKLMWLLIIIPVLISLLSSRDFYLLDEAVVYAFFTLFSLWSVGVYAKVQGNPNANYYLIGWTLAILGCLSLAIHDLGLWSVKHNFAYTFELLVMTEAMLFSVALASRLNRLSREKETLSQELFTQQQNEKIKLESTVEERTRALQTELSNNEILLRELHHRVKNNMQFITSLYALKLHENTDAVIREKLHDVERKIQAMSHVHEMLYKENDLAEVNTQEYFHTLIGNIKTGYDTSHVHFDIDVQANLSAEQAIYCGLIVNELVTNAIKYAFEPSGGTVSITLRKQNGTLELTVADDGKGLGEDAKKSFGTLMVNTLATEQLNGTIDIETDHGTAFTVRFDP